MEVEEYLPDLGKKEKEDFKNRQVSGFSVWEAVKKRDVTGNGTKDHEFSFG